MDRQLKLPPGYQGLTPSDWFALRPVIESDDADPNYPRHERLYDKLHSLVVRSLKGHVVPNTHEDIIRAITHGSSWRDMRESARPLEPVEVQAMQLADTAIYMLANGFSADAQRDFAAAVMMHHGKMNLANDSAAPGRGPSDPIAHKLEDAAVNASRSNSFIFMATHRCDGTRCVPVPWLERESHTTMLNEVGDWIYRAQQGKWPKSPRKKVNVVRAILKTLKMERLLGPERPAQSKTKPALSPAANDPE